LLASEIGGVDNSAKTTPTKSRRDQSEVSFENSVYKVVKVSYAGVHIFVFALVSQIARCYRVLAIIDFTST
jgi:hypothetical protein